VAYHARESDPLIADTLSYNFERFEFIWEDGIAFGSSMGTPSESNELWH